MSINPLKGGDCILKIEPKEGFLDEPLNFDSVNFYREGSNHAYLNNGEIRYVGNCENNLIISSGNKNTLENINNLCVYSNGQRLQVFPVSNFGRFKKLGLEHLFRKILYNIPLKVKQRESLFNYNLDEIKSILENSWNVHPKSITRFTGGKIKSGTYLIETLEGKRYVFKYKGDYKDEVEAVSELSFELSDYFPKPFARKDENLYGISLIDGFYGLEEFVIEDCSNKRDLNYLKRIGKKIALFHNDLDLYLKSKYQKEFIERRENFNESNLLSIYLDISNNDVSNSFLMNFIEEPINKDLSLRIRKTPKRIIHGDLNFSNVLNYKNGFVFIDSETLGIDFRLKEFISPLLLEGNMKNPKYIRKGIPNILDSYNQYSKSQLCQEEIKILPLLLQVALLKYYVVKEIRRGNKTDGGLEKFLENIKKIKEDSNVY